jgi:hypothetical protein
MRRLKVGECDDGVPASDGVVAQPAQNGVWEPESILSGAFALVGARQPLPAGRNNEAALNRIDHRREHST